MSDWYARKLGGGVPSQAPQRPSQAPVAPARTGTPQYHQPAAYVPPTVSPTEHYDDRVEIPITEAIASNRWKGGEGARETRTTGHCPNCGSNNYFSRSADKKMTASGMMAPAPHCFACGHNGMFDLQGMTPTVR